MRTISSQNGRQQAQRQQSKILPRAKIKKSRDTIALAKMSQVDEIKTWLKKENEKNWITAAGCKESA